MKIIDKELFKYIVSSIIVSFIIIILAYFSVSLIMEGRTTKVINTDNLIIQYTPKLVLNLKRDSDINGLNTNSYNINVTNTGKEMVKYEIDLDNINSDAEYIRVSINNNLIRNLNNYETDNHYKLGEFQIDSGVTNIHGLKMWLSKENSPYREKNYQFKVSVKELLN